jgi:protein-tyrosine phosphatase
MTPELRVTLARDGIFNTRDLGGLPTRSGGIVASRKVVRADALQRVRGSVDVVRGYGIVRVLDLRDERERDADGVLQVDGIEVQHHPVLDPTFRWHSPADDQLAGLLVTRYQDILGAFGPRFAGALTSIAEVLERGVGADGVESAVAFHCAVGKDRTGLLAALLLSVLEVDQDEIVRDYARSSAATAVQVNWLWTFGLLGGNATDEDLAVGVWSARPETMRTTLSWIDAEFGDVSGYLRSQGLDVAVPDTLRRELVTAPAR